MAGFKNVAGAPPRPLALGYKGGVTGGMDGAPPDGEEPFEAQGAFDDDEDPAPVGTFLGALGQLVAAALVVLAVLALFIAGAVVFRWVFH